MLGRVLVPDETHPTLLDYHSLADGGPGSRMLPQGLFGISPFLLILPLAVGASLWLFLRSVRRAGLDERRVLLLQVLIALSALGGAKLFSLVLEWGWNPFEGRLGLPADGGTRGGCSASCSPSAF